MASLITILKTVGKDLSHVAVWIDDGLKIVAPVIAVVDPPIGPIITAIEAILGTIPKSVQQTPDFVQKIVTAVSTIEAVKKVSS